MNKTKCESCGKIFNKDTEDYAFSDFNTYLCEKCGVLE